MVNKPKKKSQNKPHKKKGNNKNKKQDKATNSNEPSNTNSPTEQLSAGEESPVETNEGIKLDLMDVENNSEEEVKEGKLIENKDNSTEAISIQSKDHAENENKQDSADDSSTSISEKQSEEKIQEEIKDISKENNIKEGINNEDLLNKDNPLEQSSEVQNNLDKGLEVNVKSKDSKSNSEEIFIHEDNGNSKDNSNIKDLIEDKESGTLKINAKDNAIEENVETVSDNITGDSIKKEIAKVVENDILDHEINKELDSQVSNQDETTQKVSNGEESKIINDLDKNLLKHVSIEQDDISNAIQHKNEHDSKINIYGDKSEGNKELLFKESDNTLLEEQFKDSLVDKKDSGSSKTENVGLNTKKINKSQNFGDSNKLEGTTILENVANEGKLDEIEPLLSNVDKVKNDEGKKTLSANINDDDNSVNFINEVIEPSKNDLVSTETEVEIKSIHIGYATHESNLSDHENKIDEIMNIELKGDSGELIEIPNTKISEGDTPISTENKSNLVDIKPIIKEGASNDETKEVSNEPVENQNIYISEKVDDIIESDNSKIELVMQNEKLDKEQNEVDNKQNLISDDTTFVLIESEYKTQFNLMKEHGQGTKSENDIKIGDKDQNTKEILDTYKKSEGNEFIRQIESKNKVEDIIDFNNINTQNVDQLKVDLIKEKSKEEESITIAMEVNSDEKLKPQSQDEVKLNEEKEDKMGLELNLINDNKINKEETEIEKKNISNIDKETSEQISLDNKQNQINKEIKENKEEVKNISFFNSNGFDQMSTIAKGSPFSFTESNPSIGSNVFQKKSPFGSNNLTNNAFNMDTIQLSFKQDSQVQMQESEVIEGNNNEADDFSYNENLSKEDKEALEKIIESILKSEVHDIYEQAKQEVIQDTRARYRKELNDSLPRKMDETYQNTYYKLLLKNDNI